MVQHYRLALPPFSRGFHLITDLVMQAVDTWPSQGILHIFIKHTSAGLTVNENADPSVRVDYAAVFDRLVRENEPFYTHTLEGPDDMPAHIKSTIVGSSVSIPIVDGNPDLGTWQGVYLCEFRNRGGSRNLTVSVWS